MVEDEAEIAKVISDFLRAAGYEVETAAKGDEGLRRALEENFDLLILDVMLPGKSGFDICRELRERGVDQGILMLTARGEVADRVKGLKTGADDYIVKPVDPDELLARAEALLRRSGKTARPAVTKIQFGDISVDFSDNTVLRRGELIALTGKELEVLRVLINNRGQWVSREVILALVWADQPFITRRSVDVHVTWLRQKIETHPQSPRHILTVWGKGYRFNV